MPFGIINVGSTFQKEMEMAFKNMIENFVLVYLDDIPIYSRNVVDNFDHLRLVFIKWKEYGVLFNPKKFSTSQGKLLGYIVSKEGLTVDLERKKAILTLPLPTHEKGLQSFLGRINFLRRFIPNPSTMVKPLITMLKKNMVLT